MIRRVPLAATIVVGLAVIAMLGLGVWQIQRARWKADLLDRYEAAAGLPPIAFPAVADPENPPLFRRAAAFCLEVVEWRATSGRNRSGQPGWAHIASCRGGGGEGPGFQAVVGWSMSPDPPRWTGGPVEGVIAPDSRHVIRLVANDAPPGFAPAAPPSIEDIPNNHLAYAAQWFIFAGVALMIYALALRRRLAEGAGDR